MLVAEGGVPPVVVALTEPADPPRRAHGVPLSAPTPVSVVERAPLVPTPVSAAAALLPGTVVTDAPAVTAGVVVPVVGAAAAGAGPRSTTTGGGVVPFGPGVASQVCFLRDDQPEPLRRGRQLVRRLGFGHREPLLRHVLTGPGDATLQVVELALSAHEDRVEHSGGQERRENDGEGGGHRSRPGAGRSLPGADDAQVAALVTIVPVLPRQGARRRA